MFNSHVWVPMPVAFRRPTGVVDGARWLFRWLAVCSLLVTLPAPLMAATPRGLVLTLVSSLLLAWSWLARPGRVGTPVWMDVLDSTAFVGFALACPEPSAVFGIVFSTLWLRSLHGTTARALLRCALFSTGVVAVIPLWPLAAAHLIAPRPASLLGAVPIMFLTVVVSGQLGQSLLARELSSRRDAALAAVGSRLLGQTDRARVLQAAWAAASEICATSPGLRIMKVMRAGDTLSIERVTGAFDAVPATLPGEVLSSGDADATVTDKLPLDAAAGTSCHWQCLQLTESAEPSWLLLGAPKQLPPDTVVAIRSLVNQTSLALRNCTVHDQLTAQARIDGLTTLANRTCFVEALVDALGRNLDTYTVLFVDLDDFKHVNDSLGHQAGDDVLTVVAARLRNTVRPQDICARLGGDEFAILLDGASPEGALAIAQRVVDSISTPIQLGADMVRVGASVGVARVRQPVSAEELTRRADVAMYAAKAHGKGRVEVFDEALFGPASDALRLDRRLGAATAAGELVVYYQPVLSLPELTCVGWEALVRWQDPERGLVQPGLFIEAAERTGAIVDIGAFVLDRACTDFAEWQRQHPNRQMQLHVNISARQLSDEAFVTMVDDCLSRHGVASDRLVLELTESVVLDSPTATERLHAVADLGVQIAIDDFGTGYSSLTTLRSLPVSAVKIDRSFVDGLCTSRADQAVVEAIVQMAQRLGLRTVAEGVERPDQQELLVAAGADNVQGFLHLRPIPAAEFTTWLQQHFKAHPVVVPNPRTATTDVLPLRARAAQQ